MVETNTQGHLDIRTRFRVIGNIRRTLRFDERQAAVDKLPENSPVRFLAEIALHGLADQAVHLFRGIPPDRVQEADDRERSSAAPRPGAGASSAAARRRAALCDPSRREPLIARIFIVTPEPA